jgi:hypothetical protein
MNETCDRCGPAVRAVYRVDRDGELYLCRHCKNQHPGSVHDLITPNGPGVKQRPPQGLRALTR